MGRGRRYGHGDRVWINRGGGLTEGTIIEVLGETDGWLVPYSHLDGGTALLAELDPAAVSARLRR